jgi:hypothetical protein
MSIPEPKSAHWRPSAKEWHAEISRAIAVWEAQEFLREFVQEGWPDHVSSFTIQCNMSLDELRIIGLFEKSNGIRMCQRIVRVPVISEEVGTALWEKLAEPARRTSALQQEEERVSCERSSLPKPVTRVSSWRTVCDDSGKSIRSEKKRIKEARLQEKKLSRQLRKALRKYDRHRSAPRDSCVFCSGNCTHYSKYPKLKQPILNRLKHLCRRQSPAKDKTVHGSDFWHAPEVPKILSASTQNHTGSSSDLSGSWRASKLVAEVVSLAKGISWGCGRAVRFA